VTGEPFQPVTALRVLSEHDVVFVVIGGLAGRIHGSPQITNDLDICYARDEDNRKRLARALTALDARLRGPNVPDDLPFTLDAETFRDGGHFTFATRAGSLDVLGFPAGTDGYEDLAAAAVEIRFEGVTVLVTALDDLMRMKRAAGRLQDRLALEYLAALRDRRDERGER
jgi:hypothetical protein